MSIYGQNIQTILTREAMEFSPESDGRDAKSGPVAESPAADQVLRLRKLALVACRAYELKPLRITLLKHSLNTTFFLETASCGGRRPAHRPERYVIRIHRPGYQDAEAIRSELLWLQAIRRDTNLVVPEPVFSAAGDATVHVSAEDIPDPRICTLLRWLDGTTARPPLRPWLLRRVGRFLAELHAHGQQFSAAQPLARKRWDLEGLRGAAVGADPDQALAQMKPAQRALHCRAATHVRAAMDALGDGAQVFGLIHSDLFSENLLVYRGDVRAIDFDGSGWGYYLYDLAVVLTELRQAADYPAMVAELLRGYRELRQLSRRDEQFLDTFICGRIMVHSAWVATHRHDPAVRDYADSLLDKQMRMLMMLTDTISPHKLKLPSE
jgi:Ser/Thr protein kinase RdoA (MazF antagonist)